MEQLSAANSRFALELYKTLNEVHPTENIICSPISISTALAMILLGARGETAAEVSKVFHFNEVDQVHSRFQTLNSSINKRGTSYILKLANRLFGENSYNFLSEFLNSTQKLYGAELATVDFQHASEDARKEINQWVKEQTEGKIPELLASGTVDSLTKLVLVNAIYFKGKWEEEFDKALTTDELFRLNKREKKSVKMMYQKKKLPYGYIEAIKCRVLELPYKGKELSMVILLPDDIEDDSTGLKQIENQLSMENLKEWTHSKNMSIIDVHVRLPKFKMENAYNLHSDLARMGLCSLFTGGKADLSGMSGNKDIFISKIVHKAFLEVNEEGTEAAAATAGIATFAMLSPEEEFTANHPFVFLIRHNPTENILFLGRFSSP